MIGEKDLNYIYLLLSRTHGNHRTKTLCLNYWGEDSFYAWRENMLMRAWTQINIWINEIKYIWRTLSFWIKLFVELRARVKLKQPRARPIFINEQYLLIRTASTETPFFWSVSMCMTTWRWHWWLLLNGSKRQSRHIKYTWQNFWFYWLR